MARLAASLSTPIKKPLADGLQALSLQTPKSRLLILSLITLVVYILPYKVVGQFSLWPRIGWDSAPSIGLTRAYWLILHGQPTQAWRRNWLIYIVLIIVLVIIIRDIAAIKRERKS